MTKISAKTKRHFIGVSFIMAICLLFTFGLFLKATPVMAYSENVTTWTNLNFSSNSTSSVYSSPSGWTKGFSDSKATSGTINLDKYSDSMYLESSDKLPSKLNNNADDYVLMINARNSSNKTSSASAVQYYTNSTSLELKAYSNYKIVVWARVLQDAQGSIYITGLEQTLGFERINYNHAGEWNAYTFYITTGANSEHIKTELWLGSKNKNQSTNAVFFDNLSVLRISNNETPLTETENDKLVSVPTNKNDKIKYINFDKRVAPDEITNANFEDEDISNWTRVVSAMKPNTFMGVLDLSTKNESTARNIKYLGTDLTKNNNKALVLYTDSDVTSFFGLKSQDINISIYDIVKLSINVKASMTSGSGYVKLIENDLLDSNGNKIEEVEPATETITINSDQTNDYLNDYVTCSFYVKARSLYNTSFKLELLLGSEDEEAEGIIAFDNITIEYLSDEDFDDASSDTYSKKINLQETLDTFGIENSTFNTTEKQEQTLTYPLTPASWSHKVGDKDSVYYGVINTNQNIFNARKNEFKISANPGNPEGFLDTSVDTNNILMMYNFRETYQSATSSSFDLDSNSYYKLSFAYKLLPTSSTIKNILYVYVTDSNGNVLYADEGIEGTNGVWKNYVLYVSSNSYSNSLKLVLGLGNEDNLLTGQAYFDNVAVVKQEEMTLDEYKVVAENNNVLDFEEGNFNLVKDNGTDLYTALRYDGLLEEGENPEYGMPVALGGIIDAKNTEDEYEITSSTENDKALQYMLMIKTFGKATYSMTALDEISLTAGTYYKFTVYAKTMFSGTSDEAYGAEFGLSGLEDKKDCIVADEWTKYTIYVNCTEDVKVNLRFALKSIDNDTAGIVYFDNYTYETVDADDYNVTRLNFEDDNTYLFIGDTNADVDDDSSSSSFNATALWYAIPTAILAFALILAMVVYLMKKIKIKKWEKRKVNQYDREKTVHRDVIRTEAEKRRNENVKRLKEQIKEFEDEIARIDDVRSKQMETRRSERSKGVTFNAEREFKQFAKRRTAVENRIVVLNKEIDNMNTAEYLLSLQHQIAVEKARAEREAREKAFKKQPKK